MSITIDQAHVRQFGTSIDLLQQQMESAFRNRVRFFSVNAEAYEFDQVDAVEMQDLVARHQDTNLVNVPHTRRVIQPKPASVADLIDEADAERIITDPQNAYVRTFAAASNRKHDQRVIDVLFATAVTGKGGSSTAAWPGAAFTVAEGSANLTVAKMREAARILRANENPRDGDMNRWYMGYTASQLDSLLGETETTSSDFNTVKALVQGEINEFLGFEHFTTELFQIDSSSIRDCVAYRKMSVALGASDEGSASIRVRADKEDSVQVRYRNNSGATRADEKGVVKIECNES